MTEAGTPTGEQPEAATARILCDTGAVTAAGDDVGVLWKLTESGRQLDANVVRLAPGRHVAPHAEPHLDVLLLVVSGDGVLGGTPGDEEQSLTTGTLLWLPHGSTRSLTAGAEGLAYLTVHRRRPGMRIGRAR
ncbi:MULTISPECIES: cupin domain-containing protein [unclassified Streptomyces]|uniref:cupin domain-containing protein n=1 Tax=unclassified Streptomyces TaxID=2593676 RepID=UPI002258017D|nr:MULTISPECIES: hypothetical protein [unclassified Streptomyces]MCX5054109.1 hypothetical protein [Streptomyces sp. NBC_00474]MCX5063178.1 hypothetical protein [Streptomyces sp. NBC_00452]MCX5251018.1 hypothetical protein [Streptomyces sp. NBC_00201]MCX5291053.1 hypothetical protein [Streptomyces sp. NBC_00183]